MNYARRHLCFGWWSLLVYISLGLFLESLHGFKTGWYLDAGNEVRRLMFTLGHAHGAGLALVNIALGLTSQSSGVLIRRSVSVSLLWATVLLPGGFFLGGIVTFDGDPGLGVWLVPIGALLLCYSVGRFAIDLSRKK